MYKVDNIKSNPNFEFVIPDSNSVFQFIEVKTDRDAGPGQASESYFRKETDTHKRHLVCNTSVSPVNIQPGIVRWCIGEITVVPPGKKSSIMKKTTYKPEYVGDGSIMTKPIDGHLVLLDVKDEWNEQLVIDDSNFIACETGLNQRQFQRNNLSSVVSAAKGTLYSLEGKGKVIIRSPVPQTELMKITIEKDVFRIEDKKALAWSAALVLNVEANPEGEGENVLVFRGSGKILIIP